jgi:hypothetical protein
VGKHSLPVTSILLTYWPLIKKSCFRMSHHARNLLLLAVLVAMFASCLQTCLPDQTHDEPAIARLRQCIDMMQDHLAVAWSLQLVLLLDRREQQLGARPCSISMGLPSQEVPELNHLSFARLWEVYTSDRLVFDDVIDVKKRSVSVVEFRNALTAFRNAALDPSLHNGNPEYVMEQYDVFTRTFKCEGHQHLAGLTCLDQVVTHSSPAAAGPCLLQSWLNTFLPCYMHIATTWCCWLLSWSRCRALSYMAAMEYLKEHSSDLKTGWFGTVKVKVNSKWTSALAAPGPFGGAPRFTPAEGDILEDQMLARRPHLALQALARGLLLLRGTLVHMSCSAPRCSSRKSRTS